MVPAFIGFLAMILYTHLLSPAEYGIYVIGASIAGIISGIFFTGVRLSASRYQGPTPKLDLRAEAAICYAMTVGLISLVTPIVILIVHPDFGLGIVARSL